MWTKKHRYLAHNIFSGIRLQHVGQSVGPFGYGILHYITYRSNDGIWPLPILLALTVKFAVIVHLPVWAVDLMLACPCIFGDTCHHVQPYCISCFSGAFIIPAVAVLAHLCAAVTFDTVIPTWLWHLEPSYQLNLLAAQYQLVLNVAKMTPTLQLLLLRNWEV